MGGDVDRRSARRTALHAFAFVAPIGRPAFGPLLLMNLSTTGALVMGRVPRQIEASMTVRLHLPGHPVIQTLASVTRQMTDAGEFGLLALRFSSLNAAGAAAIDDTLRRAEDQPILSEFSVLLIGGTQMDRDLIAGTIERLGHAFIAVATPLDALSVLQDPRRVVRVAIVADTLLPLLGLLVDEFPEVRHVLLTDHPYADDVELARASGRARVLPRPLDPARVALAIGDLD
jgi:hypothetical protein